MLRTIALIHILVKDDPHYGSFLFVDVQFVEFVFALVDTPTPYKVILICSLLTSRSALCQSMFFHWALNIASSDSFSEVLPSVVEYLSFTGIPPILP